MIVTPFRMTGEDMAGADAKLRAAIQPVLDALNITLNDVVSILNGQVGADNLLQEVRIITVSSVPSRAAPLRFTTKVQKPTAVVMANCAPKDQAHSLASPFVMQGFGLTDAGLISIATITGLLADNSYTLTFLIQ